MHIALMSTILAAITTLFGPISAALAAAPRPIGPWAAGSVPVGPVWNASMDEATFVICGPDDPQAERAIEQFIDGRGFGTVLVSRPDGCADLTIKIRAQAAGGGRQRTTMVISSGSGAHIRVRIVSEDGLTHVSIGATG